MSGLNFVSQVNGYAGQPIHVTGYDVNDNPVDPASITWSGLPSGVTVNADNTTTPPSTVFNCATVSQLTVVHAVAGIATGSFQLNFNPPPLQFTSP